MFKEQQMEKRFWHVIGLIGLAIWENATAVARHARPRIRGDCRPICSLKPGTTKGRYSRAIQTLRGAVSRGE